MGDTRSQSGSGFISRLMSGELGLARTYWVYGVLAMIALRIITAVAYKVSNPAGAVVSLAMCAYVVCWMIGTWRAADDYEGSAVWSILAKIIVVLNAIGVALIITDLLAGSPSVAPPGGP